MSYYGHRRQTPLKSSLFRRAHDDGGFVEKGGPNTNRGEDGYRRGRDDVGNEIIIVEKGESSNITINMDNVRATLTELRAHAHVPIRELSKEMSEMLQDVVTISQLLYNSAAYNVFLEEVLRAHADVRNVRAGTVGAFFVGCFVPSGYSGPAGCNPNCAGALPPEPNTEGWSFCDKLVILYNGEVFHSLNEVADNSQAHIYIPEGVEFNGFTPSELRQLSAYGITTAKIIRSTGAGSSFQEHGDFVELSRLGKQPPRPSTPVRNAAPSSGGGMNNGLIIILVIIFFLIMLVIGWKICTTRK